MRVLVPGLLLVTVLGCGGLLSQSFDQGFMPTCLDEHAAKISSLSDPQAACECAKATIEREKEKPMERFALLADPEHMKRLLEDCDLDAGANMDDPAADDAELDAMEQEVLDEAEEPE